MKGWIGKSKTLLLMGFVAFFLSACGNENQSVLQPKGESADKILDLINISVAVMIFVFLVVMVIYTIVIIKYRKKKGQEDIIPEQTEGNKALEIVWTVIPILLLVIIAIPTVTLTFDLADSSEAEDGIRVNVVAHQFWWDFSYEGEGEEEEMMMTSQDLYIPTGEKVYLSLQSTDVIHSFWVAALAGKMDVHVENENYMSIQADEEGVYGGQCAELCGTSHSLMDFKVIAVSPEEYEQWIEDMRNTDPEAVPETEKAQAGQELFAQSCISCHAVDTNTDSLGPNLANFGNRTLLAGVFEHDADTIADWIMDPEEFKPGNLMAAADYEVTEEEAVLITEYLQQLVSTDVTPESATSAE